MQRPPVNIWNNIERCWVLRLDIVFEGQTITGIHHSDWEDAVKEIETLTKKLNYYKNELLAYYNEGELQSNSIMYTYVYLLKCNSTGLYKIGRSINPVFREKTLQSQEPDIQSIFISGRTLKSKEKELHTLFKDKRIRGEWFRLTEQDVEFIIKYQY